MHCVSPNDNQSLYTPKKTINLMNFLARIYFVFKGTEVNEANSGLLRTKSKELITKN